MTQPKTSPTRIKARERAAAAVALRKEGKSFDAIAQTLGFAHKASAYRAVCDFLAKLNLEDAKALKALEMERLDALQAAVWPKAIAGDLAAVDRAIRIAERRARLCGLDEAAEVPGAQQISQVLVSYAKVPSWRDQVTEGEEQAPGLALVDKANESDSDQGGSQG